MLIEKKGSHQNHQDITMKLKVIIHQAEEGGFWAEIPAILAACRT